MMTGNFVAGHATVVGETDSIRAAQQQLRTRRKDGLAALDALFRAGTVPSPPPDGPYHGELVALDIAPVVTPLIEWLTSFLMPWKGKFLIAAESRGDNIFSAKWRTVLRLAFPFYKGNRDYGKDAYRAFIFDTSIAQGKVDTDRQVFRIDYD